MRRCPLANWIVDTDELGAIGERCLHLHLVNHFRDTFHDLIVPQYGAAFGHEFGNRLAVACSLHHEVRYERDRFRVVELDAPTKPPTRNQRRERDQKLVSFTRREVHEMLRFAETFSMTTSSARERDRVPVVG